MPFYTNPVVDPGTWRGWFNDLPPTPVLEKQGWFNFYERIIADNGVGADSTDPMKIAQFLQDTGIGVDLASLKAKENVSDSGGGEDLSKIVIYAPDQGVGSDHSSIVLPVPGIGVGQDSLSVDSLILSAYESGLGSDVINFIKPIISVSDSGVGQDVGTGIFTPQAGVTTTITATGSTTYTIPVWCRYIDIILLGAGGGGRGLGLIGAWGNGGEAGKWYVVTLERGVDIPWTLISFTVNVGTGGNGGSQSGSSPGSAGNPTTAVISGVGTLTGAGGAGGTGTLNYPGKAVSPSSQTVAGQTYTGGGEQSSAAQQGIPPGGGGAGSIVTFVSGGPGARGQAWIRARQS
ncbi:minor tail protein [Mycobacterium phage Madruga]|uniref:Minor tail protein n=1 Tax=Mycobacterium phage Madruga TaxID=1675552 RepID=A0A0K1LRX4_9CAUD|nr:minor tail protein [Mycobacterium phage Madruga]